MRRPALALAALLALAACSPAGDEAGADIDRDAPTGAQADSVPAVPQPATQPGSSMNRADMPYVGVGCIVEHEGRFLLVRNSRNRWSTPGGLLEYGESPATAAARETLEETGVVVRSVEFVAVTNDVIEEVGRHYITIWMKGQAEGTDIVIQDTSEILEAGWFEPSAIPHPRHLFFENLLAGRTFPSPPLGMPVITEGSR